MAGARIPGSFSPGLFKPCYFSVLLSVLAFLPFGSSAQDTSQQKSSPQTTQGSAPADLPRGKKLILKDGSYQIVREYQVNGDRVRYFSLERGDWEELPAAMVDWDATKKEEKASAKAANDLAEKIHSQEEAKRLDNVTDIDASLQVGEGAFLPQAEGLYVVEGKTVRVLTQVGSAKKTDTMRTIEQVLSPVPIVPGKQRVIIQGEHATLRLKSTAPEFYLREAPPDPDSISTIQRSSRPGESGPEVVMLRAKPIHNARELESFKTLFGQQIGMSASEVTIQRWEVAPNVYRFTLGETLTPGEYVLAEVLPDGLNYFVWDFGVDAGGTEAKKKQ